MKATTRLSTPDRLGLATAAVLAAIGAATHPKPAPLLAGLAALAAALAGLAAWGARSPLGRVVHDFSPIPTILALFKIAGPLIAHANPARFDATLSAADARWFGGLADAWRGALGRPAWLTDLASLAYVSFYFVPVAIAIALYRRPRRDGFDAFVLAVLSTFLASWVGYLALPAFGPRVPPALEAQALGGSWVSQSIRAALRALEGDMTDAFPSGHAAVSLVYVAYGRAHFPRWRLPLAAAETLLLFSTVYLSLHYVVDVLGGALLAGAIAALSKPSRGARSLNTSPRLRRRAAGSREATGRAMRARSRKGCGGAGRGATGGRRGGRRWS